MKNIKILSLLMLTILFVNCSEDEDNSPLADFQFLVEGTQVTFNGTVENATSISWNFGDGASSSEEDPVYAYAAAGVYNVVMTVTGANGSFTETKSVIIQESLEILLTGGQAKPQGKSWKLKKLLAGGEGAGYVENSLGIFQPSIDNLLDAVGLGASYEDTFTFVYDGSYIVDNKNGESLMGLVYASVERGADIRAVSYDPASVPLANVVYSPKTDASWSVSTDDFTVNSLTATGVVPVTFTEKRHLILDEYLIFKDKSILVIIEELTETTMRVAVAAHTEPTVLDFPTILFHLTLESI